MHMMWCLKVEPRIKTGTRLSIQTLQSSLSQCVSLIPRVRKAKVIRGWAGGRLVRDAVRLEEERREAKYPLITALVMGDKGSYIVLGLCSAYRKTDAMEKYKMTTATL